MKNKIIMTLILLIGLSQIGFAQTKKSIDVLYSNLVRVEPLAKDYSLVFEIMCAYNGVKDGRFAIVLVPLDKNMELISDSNDQPLIAANVFRVLNDSGEDAVEVSVPLSYFPKNTDELVYGCMLIDDETEETINDYGPFVFSIEEVNQLLSQKLSDQVTGFFDLLLGSGGSNSESKYDEYGNKKCDHCHGSRECTYCAGDGLMWGGEKCMNCDGTGRCHYCR